MATPKQKALARLKADNPLASDESLVRQTHAPTTARKEAQKILNAKGTQDELKRLLGKAGVTPSRVLKRLSDSLDYEKVARLKIGSPEKGTESVREYVDVDNANRLAAVELAAKLHGWLKTGTDVTVTVNNLVVVHKEAAEFFVSPEKRADYIRFVAEHVK